MRSSFALILFLLGGLSLLLATYLFKEVPLDTRKQYNQLKKQLKEEIGINLAVMQRIDSVTLAGSDEWLRMKEGRPD